MQPSRPAGFAGDRVCATKPKYSFSGDLADKMTEDDARRLLSEAKTGSFAAALRMVLKCYRCDGWLTIKQAILLADTLLWTGLLTRST